MPSFKKEFFNLPVSFMPMPIYMDLHMLPGVQAKGVAEAHRQDILYEEEYGCKCMTYWVDEARGTIFCLIDAPDKESVINLHSKAHGLVPNKIIEVQPSLVESFLGRVSDPEEVVTTDDGLKIFHDAAFRFFLAGRTEDPVLLKNRFGNERMKTLVDKYHEQLTTQLHLHGGRRPTGTDTNWVASFTEASKAFSCAYSLHQQLSNEDLQAIDLRLVITAGDPVTPNEQLFGECLKQAKAALFLRKGFGIFQMPSLHHPDHQDPRVKKELIPIERLALQDVTILTQLMDVLESKGLEADFQLDAFCQMMAMSQSQLYRKITQLTGFTPNTLLNEFRLQKAKELLQKKHYSISDVSFMTGFTSPSYFTKCFKKKFGLLPLAYVEHL
ncbi:MAG TPA: nickel-binding protein [Flavisolibacter sp.]|nr:nickel-binding protein [Flavisolibacter sp.]